MRKNFSFNLLQNTNISYYNYSFFFSLDFLTNNCKSSDLFLDLLIDPNLLLKNLLALLSNFGFPTLYISIALFSYGANPATALTVETTKFTLSALLLVVNLVF